MVGRLTFANEALTRFPSFLQSRGRGERLETTASPFDQNQINFRTYSAWSGVTDTLIVFIFMGRV